MRVFLGGTCNDSKWREDIMVLLKKHKIDYFNPIVDDWDEKAQANELKEREACDICLYVITPKMTGVYSIAEVVDDSNKRTDKTVFCLLKKADGDEFPEFQLRSLESVRKMVEENGSKTFTSLSAVVTHINKVELKESMFPLFKRL